MKDAIGDMVLDRRDDCTCPFEAPGEAPPMTDPKSTCFDDCLRAFLTSQYGQGELNPTVCQAISDSGGGGAAFYPLYYLDHKWCGLHWNNPADLRQDPGVDKIINSCQSLGFHNFADPGWPPESYQCNVCSSSTQKQANQPQDAGFSASSTTVSEEPTSTIETPTASTSGISSSSTKVDTTGTASTHTTTPYTDSSLPAATATTPAIATRHTLPAEAIVAIAVCTTLALASAVILLFCVLRRRQKQLGEHDGDMRSRISRIVQGFAMPADSPQRLISPSHSYCTDRPPLTPPLPLRDRKLLPSLLGPTSRPGSIAFEPPYERHHSNNSQSSCYSSHRQDDKGSFPSSPICSPTYNRLEPRQEKMHQKAPSLPPEPSSPPYTRLKSPPPVSFTFPPSGLDSTVHPVPSYPKGRESSLRNEITSMTSTASSDYNTHGRHPNSTGTATTSVADAADNPSTAISTNPFAPTPPSSPTRPRRPHERPLEIPDLVSPLSSCSSTLRSPSPGPPPSKALPPPPLALRGSSPVSSAIGIATTTGSARAGHPSSSPQGQPDYHRHHHPHHHRYHAASAGGGRGRGGSRDSWGSWEDLTPTSLIGRAISPPAGRFGNEGGTVYPYPDN